MTYRKSVGGPIIPLSTFLFRSPGLSALARLSWRFGEGEITSLRPGEADETRACGRGGGMRETMSSKPL